MIVVSQNTNVVTLVEDYNSLKLLNFLLHCLSPQQIIAVAGESMPSTLGDPLDILSVVGQVRFVLDKHEAVYEAMVAEQALKEKLTMFKQVTGKESIN